jgi:membrane-associated phospholipid phosphatase
MPIHAAWSFRSRSSAPPMSASRVACWATVALGSTVLFLLLSVAAAHGPLPGDPAARMLVKAWATPAVVAMAHVINVGGTWMVLVPATALLFAVSRHARRRWWLWCLTLAAAPHDRERVEGTDRAARVRQATAYGFPSGHATAAGGFVVIALYLCTRAQVGTGRRVALAALVVLGLGVGVGGARLALDATGSPTCWVAGCSARHAGRGAAWWDAIRAERPDAGARRRAPAHAADGGLTMRPSSRSTTSASPTERWRCSTNIELTVEAGDFLGIIGPNGSGKTTLLR